MAAGLELELERGCGSIWGWVVVGEKGGPEEGPVGRGVSAGLVGRRASASGGLSSLFI
jgi:hypothetical protein